MEHLILECPTISFGLKSCDCSKIIIGDKSCRCVRIAALTFQPDLLHAAAVQASIQAHMKRKKDSEELKKIEKANEWY